MLAILFYYILYNFFLVSFKEIIAIDKVSEFELNKSKIIKHFIYFICRVGLSLRWC